MSSEAHEILNILVGRHLGYAVRVPNKVARELLLYGFTFRQGSRHNLRVPEFTKFGWRNAMSDIDFHTSEKFDG